MSNKLFGRNAYHTKTIFFGGIHWHCNAYYRQRGKNGREWYSERLYSWLKRPEIMEMASIPCGGNSRVNSNRKYFKISNNE